MLLSLQSADGFRALFSCRATQYPTGNLIEGYGAGGTDRKPVSSDSPTTTGCTRSRLFDDVALRESAQRFRIGPSSSTHEKVGEMSDRSFTVQSLAWCRKNRADVFDRHLGMANKIHKWERRRCTVSIGSFEPSAQAPFSLSPIADRTYVKFAAFRPALASSTLCALGYAQTLDTLPVERGARGKEKAAMIPR